jgi:hypothetical protein
MDDKSFMEKRRFIRFDNTSVNFKTKEIDKQKGPEGVVQAIAVNLSTEGICFMSKYKLEPGTKIELDILVPFQPRPAHLEGEVRWSTPVKTEEGEEMFSSGVRLIIAKTDETSFLLYICEKMEDRIKELEKKLDVT